MELAAAGLTEQPFRTHGKPVAIIAYASHSEALAAIRESCELATGLVLLQGPPLSGKSTIVRHFAENLDEDRAVAIVDGSGLNTAGLLEGALRQFGYEVDINTTNEMLAMLRVFAMQQTVSYEPPVLIVENAHRLNPSALRALCELAAFRYKQASALKMILVSDRSLDFIVEAPAMGAVTRRVSANIHMRPMSCDEAKTYLRQKLQAAGSAVPEYVFPNAVCVELWDASGGWPGVLDRLALLALAKADALPVTASSVERPEVPRADWDAESIAGLDSAAGETPQPPQLFVSKDGKTVRELTFDQPRLLIGRSEHNDIAIPSKFVSRHHLLLVRHGNSTFLMDLNSSNGTFVNSRRVSNHLLMHDDVIKIGNHRIKFCDPYATSRSSLAGTEFADTVIMKTLDDMRKLLAQENTAMLPKLTEDLPTYGNQ
jgi:type II secretory pathway predicted ATPase ExeA